MTFFLREISITTERIEIPISAEQLNEYYQANTFSVGDRTFFAGYNHLLRRIDIFDLDARTFTESIAWESEGPNDVPSFFIISSIWRPTENMDLSDFLFDRQLTFP